MSDMTIDEATADTTITGVEKIPASDGGSPKSLTTGQLLDYVLAAFADSGTTETVSLSDDGVYIKQGGETKRLTGMAFAQAVIGYACSLAGIVGPNGNEIFVIDDSGTKKTITLAQIAAYVTANGADFFTSLGNSDPLAASDLAMVKQGGTVKKCSLSSIAAYVLSTFADFLTNSYNVLNVQTSDKIAVVSGGTTKWMTVAQLAASLATGATVPSTTTAGNVPTYTDAAGSLGTGLAVQTSVRAQGTADNNSLPTEAAVRAAINDATSGFGSGDVKGPGSQTTGNIPTWSSTSKTLTDGKAVQTSVRASGSAVDGAIPTEKAVRDAIDAEASARAAAVSAEATARGTAINNAVADKVTAPSGTTTQGNLPQWDSTQKKLTNGKTVVESMDGTGSHANIPTEKAVRDAIAAATTNIGIGDVTGPATTTEDKIPQWDSTTKKLKNGLTLVNSGTGIAANATGASDAKVPTEKAVRLAIDAEATARAAAVSAEATARGTAINNVVADKVTAPSGTTTQGNLPQWDSTQKKLTNGKTVVESVDGTGSHANIPTEKAVRNAITAAVSAATSGLGTGDVKGPATTTQYKIPQWDSTQKKLTDGLGLVSTVGGTGLDTNVPTEKAVRTAITGATADAIAKSGTPTSGKLAKFNGSSTVTNGPGVTTSVGTTGSNDDVPTEMAVRTAITAAVTNALATAAADATTKANAAAATVAMKVSAPISHTENKIPTWGASNELKDGKSVVTTLASTGSNDNIPTEKAVRDALPVAATTAADGLMTAADKAKLDGLVDTSAVSEIGNESPLADSDVVTVLKGGTTWMKALMTRFWTYIMGKLATFKIDDLAAGDDNTDLDASTARHGLCPKFPNDSTKFLRGDGSFAVPNGSTAFTGDSGDGGASGLVPAPASGDASANKFLCANGAWAVPGPVSGVDIPGSTAINAAASADTLICYDASENAYRKMTLEQVTALVLGTKRYDTIFISAGAMMPGANNPATAGAITFSNVKHDTMAFNATADQTAEFDLVLPDGWDQSAVRAKFLWTASDSTKAEQGETVAWQIGGVAIPDEGAVTVAPSAWVTKTDALSGVNELHRTAATAALTLEGTVGEGNLLHFVVRRNNTTSELSTPLDTEALLLGVVLQYGKTEDAAQW